MSTSGVMVPRPPSHGSRVAMPHVQHPMSRLGDPEQIGVRGVSRDGRGQEHIPMPFGRPLASEGPVTPKRTPRYTPVKAVGSAQQQNRTPLATVPEGVQVLHGDPNTTRIPIFGNRSELASRAGSAASAPRTPVRAASRASQCDRLELDELEMILRDKVKTGFFEIRKKFKDNDPEGKGNVKRDALARIVVTTMNRPLGLPLFNKLMDRIGVKDKQVISFAEFFSLFRDDDTGEYPQWMDPVQRQRTDQAQGVMNAQQVHACLREKARERVLTLADMLPQLSAGGTRVLKPEFRNMLNKLAFQMDESEFEKLWSKFDVNGTGACEASDVMEALGVSLQTEPRPPLGPAPASSRKQVSGRRAPLQMEVDRQRSLDIEHWLKERFREGFSSVRSELEQADPEKTGKLASEQFLSALANLGLKLENKHLEEFLSRCGIMLQKGRVPYREFLTKFQDRGEDGVAHRILTDPRHRFNLPRSPGERSTLSVLETKLMNLFQQDFLGLLGTFHKIDTLGTDAISQEEFRAAIESRFGIEMTQAQFLQLIDRVPLTAEGKVKYADFMAQFDARGDAATLFEDNVPQVRPLSAGRPLSPPPAMHPDLLVVHEDSEPAAGRRPTHALFKVIKSIVTNKYSEVESMFYEMDDKNSMQITQEMMFQLLSKFDIQPRVTRGEIRNLWKTFITQQNGTLNFYEFVRHFGYSPKTAAFPNAKRVPPRRGDADFMQRSRKLNAATDMLQDGLRSKVDYMWEEIRKELVAMDVYGTGYVSQPEFRDVLTELCVHLSDLELETLCKKFDTKADGRVNYVEFLKPFALKRSAWRHGNNMLALLEHPNSDGATAAAGAFPAPATAGVSNKLRSKLSADWKRLRREFKKQDSSGQGLLSVPEFRSVLQLANVVLSEEELFQIMSQFDENMTGRIQYQKFLEHTVGAPPSTAGSRRH